MSADPFIEPRKRGESRGDGLSAVASQLPEGLAESALAYAASGIPVFPVAPASKKPLKDSRGVLDATTDADQIREWWSHGDYNIGAATGSASRLVVIDVDEPGADAALELPPTLRTITSRGYHLLYACSRPVRSSAGELAPKVDVRADGTYALLPPSRVGLHTYRFDDGSAVELAKLPASVADRLARAPEQTRVGGAPPRGLELAEVAASGSTTAWGEAVLRGETQRVRTARRGERNHSLYRASLKVYGAVEGGHVDYGRATKALVEAGMSTGLDRTEAYATLHSALTAAEARGPSPGGLLDGVLRHCEAADAATDEWASREGRRCRKVLAAFQAKAYEIGGGKFTASSRDLAAVGTASRATIQATAPLLENQGWLKRLTAPKAHECTLAGRPAASTWRLVIPPERHVDGHYRQAGEGSGRECDAAALFVHPAGRREALGVAADTLRLLVEHGPQTVRELCPLTGLTPGGQRAHLRKLGAGGDGAAGFALVVREAGGMYRAVPDWLARLDRIAEETGAAEKRRAEHERYRREKEGYGDYLLARFGGPVCLSCGQIFDPPRETCPDCGGVVEAA